MQRLRHMRVLTGVVLLLVGLLGGYYAWCAARSQWLYMQGKYRASAARALSDREDLAARAYALYPRSYHLAQWMAEYAWYTKQDRRVAQKWVDRGTALNPYHLDLRWLEASLLGQTDPLTAAASWEDFSESVFWHSWVLAGRIYWYAWSGQIPKAETYLPLLAGRGHYDWAAQALVDARE